MWYVTIKCLLTTYLYIMPGYHILYTMYIADLEKAPYGSHREFIYAGLFIEIPSALYLHIKKLGLNFDASLSSV